VHEEIMVEKKQGSFFLHLTFFFLHPHNVVQKQCRDAGRSCQKTTLNLGHILPTPNTF